MSDTHTTPGSAADLPAQPPSRLTDPPATDVPPRRGPVPRRQVVSWALWDWATQPFNTVIVTFVFTASYLTSDAFLDPSVAALGADSPARERALADLASGLGAWITAAGFVIAVLAPVLGRRADVAGRRKAWLGGATILLVACMLALFAVRADPVYFAVGAALIALGSVASEIAGVNYNAMLVQVSTPATIGKVSGIGWGLGYVGGILALVIIVVATMFDWWGMPTDDGLPYRVIAVGCALWAVAFAWPLFRYVPEAPPAADRPRVGFFASYAVLVRDVVELFRTARPTFWFLLASAVYRDGLAAVFTFGAIIAAVSFGFGEQQVIVFGIAANLLAGLSTIAAGRLDDRFGPRAVILGSLAGLVVCGLVVVLLHDLGQVVFWAAGLLLTCFVGPAQAASRSLLARMSPPGRESEIFGLYATTGRAASFLAPSLWTLLIALTGATIWGTLGIIVVLLAGLLLMLAVRPTPPGAAPRRP
ncbi:MFS transporter [Isoptericola variabilis]|uniref:Major facilitator superfamily MFS_1 n=1 Tax=Isoptericola variabilis (strain 225) TaxID=743718 RepID=F6FVE4_ISOV2|nr:MFS transporter [Isoptericola variabilis]AEG44371.1 major facilitator superfamily MFS_1 [Isoptericola variabilis 225]TWH34364.1 UMF1 family MFS transporter [Isoptericola variabilis J7]